MHHAQPQRRAALHSWFRDHRRDLPWRRDRAPWGVWVSEVMLQQTTVRTVGARWHRFLQRFPSPGSLAAAPLDDVLNEWSGLGYYTRARNLWRAAVAVHGAGGRIPDTYEGLLALPGMGPYTAAAVASLAFGRAVPLVDANVERVLARWFALEADVRSAAGKSRLRELAAEELDSAAPGQWNEALMELGALVCTSRDPACTSCPVSNWCAAHAMGEPARFPLKAAKQPMAAVQEAALLLEDAGRVLVLRRPDAGSFAAMWELPRVECAAGESFRDAATRAALELAGIEATPDEQFARMRHTVMRRRIELVVWRARWTPAPVRLTFHTESAWLTPSEWLRRPISTTQKKIARMLSARHMHS